MIRQGNRSEGMTAAVVVGLTVLLWSCAAEAGTGFAAPQTSNIDAGANPSYDYHPQLTTDGAGVWVVVWDSYFDMGGTSTDRDIWLSRSTDNGATWTLPQTLNTNADSDTGHDYAPQVSTDSEGHWVAVWQSTDSLGDTVGTDDDVFVSRSTDNGATWTSPQALNTNAGTDVGGWDGDPQVTTDATGCWVAVWGSTNRMSGAIGTDWDIHVSSSTDNGVTWTAPQALNSNAYTDSGNDFHPQVSTDRTGHWVAVWESSDTLGGSIGNDDDVLVARSTDNGATWTELQPLNTNAGSDAAYDRFAQVTTDRAGHWVAVWESRDPAGGALGDDADVLTARSADGGATWTAPQPLNSYAATDSTLDPDWDQQPQVTTDGMGHWVAVWQSTYFFGGTVKNDYDIVVSRSVDNGATWTTPRPTNPDPGNDWYQDRTPRLTTDDAGHWVFVWSSSSSAPGSESDILVARMDRATDTDGDGLADSSETDTGVFVDDWDTGTDPALTDTDGDALPDGWEVAYEIDPTDDGTVDLGNGADGDPDGDGHTNAEEHAAGTDPQDPASPLIEMPLSGPAALALTAMAVAVAARRRLGRPLTSAVPRN